MTSSWTASFSEARLALLARAADDLFCLLNRDYPRESALEWVGNRYALCRLDRDFLRRGVFGQALALRRLSRRGRGSDWRSVPLIVDGHNVQITVESALLGRPMLVANDGALRDLAGQSARFRPSEVSDQAMELIFKLLARFRPEEVHFFFDAPMSHSGELAGRYQRRLHALGLKGEARVVPVPEREFPTLKGMVASSDRAVIDASLQWLDLARWTLSFSDIPFDALDFSSLIYTVHARMRPFSGIDWLR